MRLAMCDAEGPNVVILRPRGAGGGRLPRPGKEVLKRLPDRLLGMWWRCLQGQDIATVVSARCC